MRWHTAAFAAALALWIGPTLGADRFMVGEWQGEARYDTKVNRFSRCTLEGQYRSGITINFGLTRNYELEIWLQHPNWRLTQDRVYDVEYWVDSYAHSLGTLRAYDSGFGRIDVENPRRTFEQLRSGVRLFVAGIGKTEVFRLDDTYAGLTRLAQCVEMELQAEAGRGGGNSGLSQRNGITDDDESGTTRGKGGIAGSGGGRGQSADPVGGTISGDRGGGRNGGTSGGGGTGSSSGSGGNRNADNRPSDRPSDRPSNRPSDDRGYTAAQFMAVVFKSPALAKFRILSGRAIPAPLRTEQVVWQGPDALGFANRLAAGDPLPAIKERIEKDRKACGNGEFDSGGRSAKLPNGGVAYRYATECRSAEDFFTSYTIYPAGDGAWYLIANLGVESVDGSATADELIFRVIVSALRS